jgi:gliding motility-associated-like protein
MGPVRFSQSPDNVSVDSSTLIIKGVWSDSLRFERIICEGATIRLDAREFGQDFLWGNGSENPLFFVKEAGEFQLTLFDGCEPANVFWLITQGPSISVVPLPPLLIHQGQQVEIPVDIANQGNLLNFAWHDPHSNSLSCLNCPNPIAMPLESTQYSIRVSNEVCVDSAVVWVLVDKTRRLFAPNVFSPNGDGQNDFFALQSPDVGILRTLQIFDRWGNVLFRSNNEILGSPTSRWDGRAAGEEAKAGVYLWYAMIEYPDGQKQAFSGDLTLMR